MARAEQYLDTESGKVLMISEDDRSAIDEFFEEVEEEDENELKAKFEKWLEEYKCPGWQIDSIRDAFMIESESSERFLDIPERDSRDEYNDMVDFAETITDDHLGELLAVALHGKGAFGRFKDVLGNYPEERQRWFEFSDNRLKKRIIEWLEDEDIELEA